MSDLKPVYVRIPASAAYDLEKMNRITKGILGKLGCPGCHSGFDIRYLLEREFIVNEKLEIREAFDVQPERFAIVNGH